MNRSSNKNMSSVLSCETALVSLREKQLHTTVEFTRSDE